MISNLLADLRFSARGLSSRPGFVVVVVLTLAFGIGVNVAIFSLYQQILLRQLPVAEPERLVNLRDPGPEFGGLSFSSMAGGSDAVFSYPMFRDLERVQEPFAGIAAHRIFDASLSTGEQARRDSGIFVSGSYFPLLGLQPALGRLLGPQDDSVDGQADSVVLGHAFWQAEFGGDPSALGRTLIVNGTPLTIVGVAPRGFHGTTVGTRASVFVPITFRGVDSPFALPNNDNRQFYWVYIFARLAPGIGREEAVAAINPLYRAILNELDAPLLSGGAEQELAEFGSKAIVLDPGERGQSVMLAPVRDRLVLLFAVSGAVLLLCCANVAGLLLVRGAARSGELTVRASIGASRARLASLLFAESLLLALPAAVASLPVALLTLRAIAGGTPGIPPAAFDVGLDAGAAFVAVCVAVLSALAFGLLPLRGLMGVEPGKALQAYGARQTSGKGVARFRAALATAQIALSMALLAVAVVFAQSLANIARIDLGLNVDSLVTFSIAPEASGYSPDASATLFDRLEQELEAIPGVISAASAFVPLLAGADLNVGAAVDGAEGPSHFNYIGSGFFRTLDIALLAGREFADTDTAGAPEVAIVNQRFAERFGLGSDAVGRRVRWGPVNAEIVGLSADAKYDEVTGEIEPQMFLPRRQSTTVGSVNIYVRGVRPPQDLMNAVRDTVARVDPIVPVTGLRTMQQQVRENLATERFVAGSSSAFAVLATVLAGLGIYGVLAYGVAQRAREIGLRFALGAPASRIRAMVLRQMAVITLVGLLLGAIAAVLLGRAAASLLFGIEAGDPVALAAAAAVLAAVSLLAAYVPARRASRVDPMVVLRYE